MPHEEPPLAPTIDVVRGTADEGPDAENTAPPLLGPLDVRSVALTGLLVLAVVYSIYAARAVLMPITLALMLSFLLAPAVAGLERLRAPRPVATGIVLIALLGMLGYGGMLLAGPAAEWLDRAPQNLAQLRDRMQGITQEVERLSEATQSMEELAQGGRDGTGVTVSEGPSLSDRVFSGTRAFIGGGVVTLVLIYFLLSSGDLFLRKVVRALPRLRDKKRAVEIARATQKHISNYLFTISLINIGLAAAQAVALWLLGVPNAILWGVMAGLLNFLPYVGPIIGTSVMAMVAFFTFEDTGHAVLVPTTYLGISLLEGNLITPILLGRSLMLNPVMIFIWIIFWAWMWGIVGTLIAVPLLAAVKIFCDHIEPLAPLGDFLGGDSAVASSARRGTQAPDELPHRP
jgi:predicted PurR-regulated permease PerM